MQRQPPCKAFVLVALALVALLIAAPVLSQDAPAQNPPSADTAPSANQEPDFALCWVLFVQATPERRAQAIQHLNRRYSDFVADVFDIMAGINPNFYAELEAELASLVTAKYPDITSFVQQQVSLLVTVKYPQLGQAVSEMLRRDYAPLLEELARIPAGPQAADEARRIIREKYPRLIPDVVKLVQTQFPQALTELQTALVTKYPQLLFDIAAVVGRKYPQALTMLLARANQKAPGLVAELIDILAGPPSGTAPTAPVPEPPPQQ